MKIVNTLAPQVAPLLWVHINVFVFSYSVALLFVNAFLTEDHWGKRFAQASYLYYSLITTVIWCSFVGLEVAHDKWETRIWETRIELIMAVFFTASSVEDIVEWRLKDQSITFAEIEYIANAISYGYESRKEYLRLKSLREGYANIEEADAVAAST